jgi:transposase
MTLPLDQLPDQTRQIVESILTSNQRLEAENRLLREQIRLMQINKYGKRSEKLSDNQLHLLEGEPSVTAAEVEREAALAEQDSQAARVQSKSQRQANENHPGRVQLPAHLDRREVILPCPAQDCRCPQCQGETTVIGYESAEELDVTPAQYFVKVIKREKRACLKCPEAGVKTAPCPSKMVPRSKLSDRVIIEAVIKKYDEHLPVYRQCAGLERDAAVQLSRATLVDAIMAVGGYLEPIRQVLRQDLMDQDYIQADETPVPCRSPRTRGRNHQAYMWEYSRPKGPVVFDFRMGRQRDGPQEFLRGFCGTLQTDGYAAYDKLGLELKHAGCWSHVRRGFYKAHLLAPQEPIALELLEGIKALYAVEEQARQHRLGPEQRRALRDQQTRSLVQALKVRLVQVRQEILPNSALGKACSYALGQWPRLLVFLEDGRVEIDNNWCENAIRPIVLGRKNWLHIGSEQAGPKIAAIASVIETCRRLEINVRDYLSQILPKLPEWPIKHVAQLSPLAWPKPRV